MLGLIAHNLRRRASRTLLTAVGIGLGVATIVSLISISAGLRDTAAGLVHLGGSDLGVFQSGVADPTASVLPVDLARRLEARPDVARATPVVLVVEGVRRQPSAVVFGAEPGSFFVRRAIIARGRRPAGAAEAIVGDDLARSLGLRPGGRLTVKGRGFTVAGIYHTGITFEDDGAILDLGAAQRLAGRVGEATTIPVELAPAAHPRAVARAIEREVPGTTTIATAEEAARAGANNLVIRKAVLLFAVLALVVGGISVTNTIALAVSERQAELALLRCMGWSQPRLAALVLGEGVGVSVLGAAIGLLLGVIGAGLLADALGVGAFVSPSITAWGLGRGLLVGMVVGVLGGLYPAWRVTQVQPARVLARA